MNAEVMVRLITLLMTIVITIGILNQVGSDDIRDDNRLLYFVGVVLGAGVWAIITALTLYWPMILIGGAFYVVVASNSNNYR